MTTRCFAFGCSLTHYACATWADFVGSNFDEYYNYAQGGASNTFIMDSLIEADDRLTLNAETDYVVVMLTGFNRFSFIDEDSHWNTKGDLYTYYDTTKDSKTGWFLKNMWNDTWAVYSSWVAAKTIKSLLKSKNIPHKILMGMDNIHFLEPRDGADNGYQFNLNKNRMQMAQDIHDLTENDKSFHKWFLLIEDSNKHLLWRNENNRLDGHAAQKIHYKYFKEQFPEFVNTKTEKMFEYVESIFLDTTQKEQSTNFYLNFYRDFNKRL